MSKFTFNLNNIGSIADTSAGASLYASTSNEDLTYAGDDYIVWDRINRERLRRGLPGLAEIGSPRPLVNENESTVSGSNKTATTFDVIGPPNLTLEQARAVFDQQVKTGSLVGLKPGNILSAATQAAAGLSSATALLSQAQSGIAGAIGSISTAVAKVGSTATGAITKITQTLSSTPLTAPINIVNVAKQADALTSIGSMSAGQVTGVLAQTKNLVSQSSSQISNTKGLGEFGLDVAQLERAGIVKPGTSSLIQAGAALTDTLKSPAVFTGKDGIKSVENLLSNPAKQSEIQQKLMSEGVNQLAAVGIPVDKLSAQGLAGIATNAAKSIPGTEALLKGLPMPGGIPTDFVDSFNKNIRDGAFAASFSELKTPPAFKAEIIPIPAENTVQRETVNAAITRVVGNDKVPSANYGPIESSLYSSTLDDDLTYAGTDPIVWDRVNNERLRRGLPSLSALGFPRPPEIT